MADFEFNAQEGSLDLKKMGEKTYQVEGKKKRKYILNEMNTIVNLVPCTKPNQKFHHQHAVTLFSQFAVKKNIEYSSIIHTCTKPQRPLTS